MASEKKVGREQPDGRGWTYLISQPHDSTGRGDRDETAGNETLDANLLCGFGERDLVLLLSRADTADDNVDTLESIGEGLFGALEVAFADLDTSFLQRDDGGFLDGSVTDESVEFL